MSFLIAKQPIFDKEGNRVAFEVYLRKKENLLEYPKDVPFNRATYIITEIILEQGIKRIGEGKRVLINVSLDSLMNKALEALEPNKLIVEIVESQLPIGDAVFYQIVKSVDAHLERGVIFSVNERLLSEDKISYLLDRISIISVEVKRLSDKVVSMARAKSKILLISRIESEADYKKVKEVGDLFQGIFLEGPILVKEFQTTPYLKNTLLRLMSAMYSAQSIKELASIIATDVGMTAKVLRLVNSAYYSPIREVKSIEQACALLGMKNLRGFLIVLAMNDFVSIENPELWKKSLVRAIIAQRIAEKVYPQYEQEAYLMGMFSLIDEILNVNKISFLKEVHIEQKVIDGYTGKDKTLRGILDYSIVLEEKYGEISSSDNPEKHETLVNLERFIGISAHELLDMARQAFHMAETILRV
jgi:EAL and modified HD-GYP domain-containing signal transduction protein